MNQILSKIPQPVIVILVLTLGLAFIVFNNPMKNGCDVEIDNFSNRIEGVVTNSRTSKKRLAVSEIKRSIDLCKKGNSQGACADYFAALKKMSDALMFFKSSCSVNLMESEKFADILPATMKDGLKIMALVAWGEQPPESVGAKLGWLTIQDLQTFCRLKLKFEESFGEEEIVKLRQSVFLSYPDKFSDKVLNIENKEDVEKPKALKTSSNPMGTMTEDDVYQKSLFSVNCDKFL